MGVKFSVITPVYNRLVHQTVLSVDGQESHCEWEHIIVDDGSNSESKRYLRNLSFVDLSNGFKVYEHDQNRGRVAARNTGMKAAIGEWICWLDSDDYMLPHYLEVMDQMTKKYPEVELFNFGGIIVSADYGTWVRPGVSYGKGQVFKSGGVMSGGFMFKRSLLEQTGLLPEAQDPYTFGKAMKQQHPELNELYGDQNDLGNPWGDDWAMFYKLTRVARPQLIKTAPYVVMTRLGEGQQRSL